MFRSGISLRIIISILPAVLYVQATGIFAQEVIYPQGHNFTLSYGLSSNDFDIFDTLTITRSLANNENFDLHNLFFNDNLPSSFDVFGYEIAINDIPITYYLTGPWENEIVFGYKSYHWVIDLPTPGDTLDHILGPGQTLELSYKAQARETGQFILPFHTVCFYGDAGGFFSVSDSLIINVHSAPCPFIAGDANDDQGINGIDVIFMVSFFKGGEPPPVICYCPPVGNLYAAADANGNCNFNGLDIVFFVNYLKGVGGPPRTCPACP